MSQIGAGILVSGATVAGGSGSASASPFGGSVDIREVRFLDNAVHPEDGDTLTISVHLRNTYDEAKPVFFILDLVHEKPGQDRFYHVNLDQEGALRGAGREIPAQTTRTFVFEWTPPVDMDPGVYRYRLTVNDENDRGWSNYDQWGFADAIAVGYDVDISCKNAVENHVGAIQGSGGGQAASRSRGGGLSLGPGLAAIVLTGSQVAKEC